MHDTTDGQSQDDAGRGARDGAASLQAAFTHAAVGLSLTDLQGRFLEVNPAFCAVTGYTAAELLGSDFPALTHPDDLPGNLALMERLRAGDVPRFELEKRYVRKDGAVVWVRNSVSLVRDAAGRPAGTIALTEDITAQIERGRRERFLAELAERARGLTDPEEVIADAVRSVGQFLGVSRCLFADIDIEADTCTVPPEYCADDSVASIAGVFPFSAFGAFVAAEYRVGRAVVVDDVRLDLVRVPVGSLAAYEAIGVRAHATVPVVHSARVVSCISIHSATPRHWTPDEVELLQTVVERTWLTVAVTRQQRALVREAEATARILESITDGFHAVDRDWRFTYLNAQAERLVFRRGQDLLGRSIWDEFPEAVGTTFEREYRRAAAEGVAVSFEEFYPPLGLWLEVRAFPSPDGLSVFFQDVSARKRAEEELRARAVREALINRIGQAVRSTTSPERIQEQAAALLGEALGADRCYFSLYDRAADAVRIAQDWRRPDLPSVAGTYRLSEFQGYVSALYARGNAVIADAQAPTVDATIRPVLAHFGIRAFLAVPLLDGGRFVAAVAASMSDGPRAWTAAEVALMEAALTQTRFAMEAARVQRREHNIAVQLAQALQPDLPGAVPGLALARHYEPALAESEGVGGDFYDCYALDKGRTALVVGDLSGKGLAAAAQVAAVRHGLRTTLHLSGGLADAVTDLNRVLAEQNLLTGFATLFVGAYDSATRTLRYVGCGQEPALVRRAATGEVELLSPTGPVLGGFEGAAYAEGAVTLAPGDALAIFSDGVTEVGRTRTEMLGIEGVIALFAQPIPPEEAARADDVAALLAHRLIAGVDAAAHGGVMRDDVCLLVGVAA